MKAISVLGGGEFCQESFIFVTLILWQIISGTQLFRERLSYKSVKVNATMSKVIIGNDGFALD